MKRLTVFLAILCALALVAAGCALPSLPNFGKVEGVDVTAKVTSPPLKLGEAEGTTIDTENFTATKGMAFVDGEFVATGNEEDEVLQYNAPSIPVPEGLKGQGEQVLGGIDAIMFELDRDAFKSLTPIAHIAVTITPDNGAPVTITRALYEGHNEFALTNVEKAALTNIILTANTLEISIITDLFGSFSISNLQIQGYLTAALDYMGQQ